MRKKPIGIFDSGLGGLTVFREISKMLPGENLIYFGDTAHVPYGLKSPRTVTRYSVSIAKFLADKNIKLLVIGCNSASGVALGAVKKSVRVPVIDVITPGVREALKITINKRIGIIGTKATINSNAYAKKIKAADKKIKVYQMPCPLFVPLAEEGWWTGKITLNTAEKYLYPLKARKIDTLILGCTHYPLIEKTIKKVMGSKVTSINSAKAVSFKVKDALQNMNLLNTSRKPEMVFYSSDSPSDFKVFAQKILKKPLKKVNLKNLNG